jgi:hypothetical protein
MSTFAFRGALVWIRAGTHQRLNYGRGAVAAGLRNGVRP